MGVLPASLMGIYSEHVHKNFTIELQIMPITLNAE